MDATRQNPNRQRASVGKEYHNIEFGLIFIHVSIFRADFLDSQQFGDYIDFFPRKFSGSGSCPERREIGILGLNATPTNEESR